MNALASQADRSVIARHDDRRAAVAAGVDVRWQRERQDLSAAAL